MSFLSQILSLPILVIIIGLNVTNTGVAATVFSQTGTPTVGPRSHVGSLTAAFDDFMLAADSDISEIRWTGWYSSAPTTDDFTFSIYSDSAGSIGSLLKSISSSFVSRTMTGVSAPAGNHYSFSASFASAEGFLAGTYWLSIQNDTGASPFWHWSQSDAAGNSILRQFSETQLDSSLLFELDADVAPVPLPASLPLALIGLVSLGWISTRKKKPFPSFWAA